MSTTDRPGRRLELWWRRRMVRLLAALLRLQDWARTSAPRAARRADGERVLFLRPDRIGDMIVSTGVIRTIAAAPGVQLDVLASPANAPVLAREPLVHEVLILNRHDLAKIWQSIRAMRARGYDTVIDCMPTAPSVTTLMIMLASGARRRVGTLGRGLDEILSPAAPSLPIEAHIVDHLALLATPFVPSDATIDPSPVIELGEDERLAAEARWAAHDAPVSGPRCRLLVNISAGKTARHWPIASYADVIAAARAIAPSLTVCIVSAPHDRERGEALASLTHGHYLATRTLRDAFAVVAQANLFFTPDTSLAHAAAAFRVPTVDLLLAGNASQWGLYRAPGINLECPGDSLESLDARVASETLQQLLSAFLEQSMTTARNA
ncbi:MAG: glycosyltransferase family 9 protein [Gemmatimonas sp.]|nr:glycosyltransferase family 9 protein [Gemmatimonas sp.]